MNRQLLEAYNAHKNNDISKAIRLYEAVLDSEPKNADALHLYGVALKAIGNLDGAIDYINRACEIEQYSHFYKNLGNAYDARGDKVNARISYLKSYELDSQDIEVLFLYGKISQELEKCDDAQDAYRRVLEKNHSHFDSLVNYGLLRKNCFKDIDGAIENYNKALKIDKNNLAALNNLGNAFMAKCYMSDAIQEFEKCLIIESEDVNSRHNLSLCKLIVFDFDSGFELYRKRYALNETRPFVALPALSKPLYANKQLPLKNKSIYIYWEQGFGDTIQFLRFLPWFKSNEG